MTGGSARAAGTRGAPERDNTVMLDEFQKVTAPLSVVLVLFERR